MPLPAQIFSPHNFAADGLREALGFDASLLMSASALHGARLASASADGGLTWSAFEAQPELPTPWLGAASGALAASACAFCAFERATGWPTCCGAPRDVHAALLASGDDPLRAAPVLVLPQPGSRASAYCPPVPRG